MKPLTEEKNAKLSDNLVCIQMDANSKLGKQVIKGDPHEMSKNGKALQEIIISEDLIVINATEKCKGTITRFRKSKTRTEQSILDYFVVCRQMFNLIISMEIDEERNLVLTKYANRKGEKVACQSDHNIMWCKMNISWISYIKRNRMLKST